MKDQDSGAGPKNISDILTQSRLSPLASNVSAEMNECWYFEDWPFRARRAERTEVIAPAEEGRAVVNSSWKVFEQADRHVTVLERERLAEVPARRIHTCRVSTKMAARRRNRQR